DPRVARVELRSPYAGRIIGMARNQVVMPGFAAFHVGIQTAEDDAAALDANLVDDTSGDDSGDEHIDGISE
ncbi:MAG: deacylase, partial [Pseudomonadota bacterium]